MAGAGGAAMAGAAGASPSTPPGTAAIDTNVLAMVNGTATCVPLADATDAWVDAAPAGPQTVAEMLVAGANAVLGGWVGMATAPPNFGETSWIDRFDFNADGTYASAGRDANGAKPPLYYGDPEQCPPAPWSITDVSATGFGGDIGVEFGYGTSCGLPAWQGLWSNIRWDATGLRMRFSFMRSDGYGPIDLDLRRACPHLGLE
jgi:hypothetical protein